MILEKTIERVSEQQRNRIETQDYGLRRELLSNLNLHSSHALIISGIRRCGKSTLLMQIIKELNLKDYIYINFETPQLYGFSLNDFTKLDNIIKKQNSKILFFDEIQLIDKWEIYVRQKLDEGFQIVITGSNAS
ncbi:MAG TPA: AAA family ATPase, partial [Candidatus Kapabacteria bacterium]|nr:AAA family ATPase [Candidatus Kapabacteria bacterium]